LKKKSTLSEKDKKSWEEFLKNSPYIQDKEEKEREKKKFIRYKFDLHGLSIEEAIKKVTEIIENCYDKGISEILLITGQGHHSNLEKNVYVSKDHSTLKATYLSLLKHLIAIFQNWLNR